MKMTINNMKEMIENLNQILEGHKYQEILVPLYKEIINFMMINNWRGACHESCGVQFLLLNELGIDCEWRLGEVTFKDKYIQNRPVCFDHSWILIDNEIFDIALLKTNIPDLDTAPTIRNKNLLTLTDPDVIYDTDSGWGDDVITKRIKTTPLSSYFNMSTMHPRLGTWILIQKIGHKLGINSSIIELRKKYNGIYWQ